MQLGTHVGLSGQLALQERLETLAHNIANATTPGFRAREVSFEALLSPVASGKTHFASSGQTFITTNSGPLTQTGNDLDLAVEGSGWLALETPNGTAYTRDGRARITPEGELRSVSGYPILDAGGAPIQLDPNAGPPRISRDGTITQDDVRRAVIGLFRLDPAARLSQFENSGVVSDLPGEPVTDFVGNGIVQGFVERANVNPVREMTRLIMLLRTFDGIAQLIDKSEQARSSVIRTLGEVR